MMTLMTVIYGLILEGGRRLYFVGLYPFNLTRRTRRGEQESHTYAIFEAPGGVRFVESPR
jgi:hypothetical protein